MSRYYRQVAGRVEGDGFKQLRDDWSQWVKYQPDAECTFQHVAPPSGAGVVEIAVHVHATGGRQSRVIPLVIASSKNVADRISHAQFSAALSKLLTAGFADVADASWCLLVRWWAASSDTVAKQLRDTITLKSAHPVSVGDLQGGERTPANARSFLALCQIVKFNGEENPLTVAQLLEPQVLQRIPDDPFAFYACDVSIGKYFEQKVALCGELDVAKKNAALTHALKQVHAKHRADGHQPGQCSWLRALFLNAI